MSASPVSIDGALVPPERAVASVLSDGFQYGFGLFETIRVQEGRLVFFADHAARLRRAAAAIGLAAPDPEGARARCGRLLAASSRPPGALKWMLYRNEAGNTSEAIAGRPNPYRENDYRRGFALRSAPGAGGPFKLLARAAHLLARQAAKREGADDALFVGAGGDALETTIGNIFAVEKGVVLTPPLDGRLLPGIARARVVRLGSAHEALLPLDRLLAADEVFVTNALIGVMPVARVDAKAYSLEKNPVSRELRRLYEAEASGSILEL